MRKFLKHIILFILPIMIGLVILFILPKDHKRAYHYLSDDCDGRAAWMYRRIYESKIPVDIAFLGTSHTINGINDTLINNQLNGITTCNLGYCRLGRDLTYTLMKTLIKEKRTKTFIIEVLPDETSHSHPVFAFLSDTKEVLDPKTLVNRSYLPNLYNASVSRLMFVRQNIFKESYNYQYYLSGVTGFSTHTISADTIELNKSKERRYKKKFTRSSFTRNLTVKFPRNWLTSIAKLSKANNLRIVFLYIPPYGSPEEQPIEMDAYTKIAPLWIPPDSIFGDKKNWYDDEHLNVRGANEFSTWVAGKIKKEKLN